MNEPKHTALPWVAKYIGYGHQINPDIAWMGDGSSRRKEEHAANARFIIQACNAYYPMLEALQSIGKAIENGDPQNIADKWHHAQTVIAKTLETP